MRKSQKGKGRKCLGLDPGLKVDQVNMGPDAAYSTMTSLDLSTTKKRVSKSHNVVERT